MSSDECVINTGDQAWVGISTVLVLLMTPALGFFEAGLLRGKNTISILNQVFGGFIIMSLMWFLFGYTLVFGNSVGGFIGDLSRIIWLNVSYEECRANGGASSLGISEALYALFQMMFASITPLLMTGAFAERLRWRVYITIIILWEILVYYPVAHWIWGNGWLAELGTLDFAGGIVIHTTAGTGAFVMALLLGRRKGYDKYHGEFPPSNLPLACIGAALLYIGWFGFNAGSALASDGTAIFAIGNTQMGAVSSGFVWLTLNWIRHNPSLVATINGLIAGLAGITPAAGYISAQSALGLGAVLGLASYGSVILMKHKLRIDDALDVSSVHGLTGIIGSLAIGVCTHASLNPNGFNGVFYGGFMSLGVQTLGVVIAIAWSAFWTLIIALILKKIFGSLKLSPEEEARGLDEVEHNETAYLLHGASTIQEAI